MSYNNKVPQKEILHVTKRYKILSTQDERILDLEKRLHIPASALVRLAIDCFLPKIQNMEVTEDGIFNLWSKSKF